MQDGMTIGELAKRAGVAAKTIRFYSNEGLLPASGRTSAGYRLYTDDDLERLALIRALRDAGLELAAIKSVLERELTLHEALSLRLAVIEAHLTSLRRVASAIRAALRTGSDDESLWRVAMVTNQTNQDRRKVIERFFADAYQGVEVDPERIGSLLEASIPKLPDEPTGEQIDAWVELTGIVSDPGFVHWKRRVAQDWEGTIVDPDTEAAARDRAMFEAREAIEGGVAADSKAAADIAERFLAASAAASGREFDDDFRADLRKAYETYDPRELRYWELVSIINQNVDVQIQESAWLQQAIRCFLDQRVGSG